MKTQKGEYYSYLVLQHIAGDPLITEAELVGPFHEG